MAGSSKDTGVIMALVQRFETQRLPHAQNLKEKVDRGEVLSKEDIAFLDQVLKDAKNILPMANKHPEWQSLVTAAMGLYKAITDKALENEQASSAGKY